MTRALLSTIKNLGAAPCPRCLIKKKDIPGVGTWSDAQKRRPRIDNDQRHQAIEEARKSMFEKGLAINSKAVQKHLNVRSMVPTQVSIHLTGLRLTDTYSRTHFQKCLPV
jgi:hypothetical protein